VYAEGANIGDAQRGVMCQLLLNSQIPLLNRGSFRIRLYSLGREKSYRRQGPRGRKTAGELLQVKMESRGIENSEVFANEAEPL